MIFRILYSEDYRRLIPACLIDSRYLIPEIATASGFEVKAYTDAKTALVNDSVLFYKIETEKGNYVGYFTVRLFGLTEGRKGAVLYDQQLRPAFVQFTNEISSLIANFISFGYWMPDFLT